MSRPITDYLDRAAMAKRELERRQKQHLVDFLDVPFHKQEVTREFLIEQYLRLLDQAFSGNNLQVARQVLESLERITFGKVSEEPETKSRKAKSNDNASIT